MKPNINKLYTIIPILGLLILAWIAFNLQSTTINKSTPANRQSKILKEPGSSPGDWLTRQRAYPHGRIRTEAWLEAINDAAVQSKMRNSYTYNWQPVGPLNIGGRITDIEMPEGSFSTIYIGAASGGIFKTKDAGRNWENIFNDEATISIGDIAIGKTNTDLIWAGTGEANASSQSFRGNGVYKSMDGGISWSHKGLEFTAYIGRIIIDHNDENKVMVATCGGLFTPDSHRGVYRTKDGGNSWEKVLFISDSTSAIDLVQHPTNPQIWYAAMWERMRGLNYRRSFGPSSGIWKSTDGGDTWAELTGGLPTHSGVGRIGLAISPSSPDRMYAFYDNQSRVEVYRSNNGGTTWQSTNDAALDGMNSSFGWYFGQIRVHPQQPDVFYLMGVDLFYSPDGGNSYTQLAGYYNMPDIHVDHHAMYIHPVTGRIYEGNDGGLYMSDDVGYTWTWLNNLPITQFYDIEIDYLNPFRIYGGTQDNNSIRTFTGENDEWEAILGGDGFYSLVDYTASNIIYAESQYGNLYKSTNSGNNMSYIGGYWYNDRVNWSAPVIMHPTQPTTLYFGTYRVWKTINGGNSWQAVSGDLTRGDDGSGYHTLTTLAISPVDPAVVLAGSDDGRVHISVNGGTQWTNISAGLPDRWITRVACDPFDVNVIYATCSGFRWDEALPHVYRSTDLGAHWQPISGNLPALPVNAFIADPNRANRLFVGLDAGIYVTTDSGENWENLNTGIGNVPIISMKIHKGENMLVIGTYGLSAYKLYLDELAVEATVQQLNESYSLTIMAAYPVPLSQGAVLHFKVGSPQSAKAEIVLLDLQGRIQARMPEVNLKNGINPLQWNISQKAILRPGTYILQVRTARSAASMKIPLLN